MFDPVPWFVGGGAQHSPETARLLAFAAFSGAEGVVGSGDMKVSPLATPGSSVRVAPGACSILNRSGSYESYAGRLPSEDVLPIAATTASGPRSDLIVARVEDPYATGTTWTAPVDPKAGPYIFTRVISNVAATTTDVASLNLGYSAIALARIDLPASTSVVNAANIVDLRVLPTPRSKRLLLPFYPSANNDLTATGGAATAPWPSVAGASITIPSWATKARLLSTVSGASVITGSIGGGITIRLGGIYPQHARYAGDVGNRLTLVSGGVIDIPANQRGTVQRVESIGYRDTTAGALRVDGGSSVFLDIEFVESVV